MSHYLSRTCKSFSWVVNCAKPSRPTPFSACVLVYTTLRLFERELVRVMIEFQKKIIFHCTAVCVCVCCCPGESSFVCPAIEIVQLLAFTIYCTVWPITNIFMTGRATLNLALLLLHVCTPFEWSLWGAGAGLTYWKWMGRHWLIEVREISTHCFSGIHECVCQTGMGHSVWILTNWVNNNEKAGIWNFN